jgi:polar amino acid transport system substrate-binding protein
MDCVMRTTLALLAAAALSMTPLVACGEDASDDAAAGGGEAEPASAFRPRQAGTLSVATSLPAPNPGFWLSATGAEVTDVAEVDSGFEADLATAIAGELGLERTAYVDVAPDALTTGRFAADLALSQVTVSEDVGQAVDFSVPYFEVDLGIVVREGQNVESGPAARGLEWGVRSATTGATFVRDAVRPRRPPTEYPDTAALAAALSSGEVDAIVLDTPSALQLVATEGTGFAVAGQFETGEQYAAVLPEGSENTALVSRAIGALVRDGALTDLLVEHFGGDPAGVPFVEL